MIPARIGSKRLKKKNLAMINKRPLIYYAIEAAKKSKIFNTIYINSDDECFSRIAKDLNVSFYLRPKELGSDNTKSDKVVADFLQKTECENLAWINSIAPLQTHTDIKNAFNHFLKNNLDTLHTIKDEQVHCLKRRIPLNFKKNELFDKTQNLIPISKFVYSTMIWRKKTFMRNFKTKGYAFFSGKVGYFKVDVRSSYLVKTKEDLFFCENLLKSTKNTVDYYKV